MVDTVFVSCLTRSQDPRHAAAYDYFTALRANGTQFYMTTFVIGEFLAGQEDDSKLTILLQLIDPKILPYDIASARRYAELTKIHPGFFRASRDEKNRRIVDLMIVAIADVNKIESIVTQDKHLTSTFLKDTNITGLDIDVPFTDFFPLFRRQN